MQLRADSQLHYWAGLNKPQTLGSKHGMHEVEGEILRIRDQTWADYSKSAGWDLVLSDVSSGKRQIHE